MHAYVRTGKHNRGRRRRAGGEEEEEQQQQAARRRRRRQRMFLKVFSSISKRIVSNAFVHAKQKHPDFTFSEKEERRQNGKKKKKKMTCRLERKRSKRTCCFRLARGMELIFTKVIHLVEDLVHGLLLGDVALAEQRRGTGDELAVFPFKVSRC